MTRKKNLITAGLITLAVLLLVALCLVVNALSNKATNGYKAMHEREAAECEAKGGTYSAKPLYDYASSCVSPEGHYLHLDAYTQKPEQTEP